MNEKICFEKADTQILQYISKFKGMRINFHLLESVFSHCWFIVFQILFFFLQVLKFDQFLTLIWFKKSILHGDDGFISLSEPDKFLC